VTWAVNALARVAAMQTPRGGRQKPISSDRIRRRVVESSFHAGVGHIGSCLSVVDLLAAIFEGPFDFDSDDRFILSKGHAALALYSTLAEVGMLTSEELATFCQDGQGLGVHPSRGLPRTVVSTGSLGMGLGVGAGLAVASRLRDRARRVVVLMSDAECNEGSTWEAIAFAGHHTLHELIAVVDVNGQQALGRTSEILSQTGLESRWRENGWRVEVIDGHDGSALGQALELIRDRPLCILARTTFGRGVSFMEGELEWHYRPLTPQLFEIAMAELAAA
jgi:transketolase